MSEQEEVPMFERQTKLAAFLEENAISTEAWDQAGKMLHAAELFDACEYTLALLGGLSTDDFAAGGDAPARVRLWRAITNSGCRCRPTIELGQECAIDVRRTVAKNQIRSSPASLNPRKTK